VYILHVWGEGESLGRHTLIRDYQIRSILFSANQRQLFFTTRHTISAFSVVIFTEVSLNSENSYHPLSALLLRFTTIGFYFLLEKCDMEDSNISAINRCLSQVSKLMDKLQGFGVLANVTYCLPGSATIYTKGWETIAKLTKEVINKEDKNFTARIEKDLLNLKDGHRQDQELTAILGYLPPTEGASRDKIRPLLLEMIRISQSRGKCTLSFVNY
jgi:hypothetical protein